MNEVGTRILNAVMVANPLFREPDRSTHASLMRIDRRFISRFDCIMKAHVAFSGRLVIPRYLTDFLDHSSSLLISQSYLEALIY